MDLLLREGENLLLAIGGAVTLYLIFRLTVWATKMFACKVAWMRAHLSRLSKPRRGRAGRFLTPPGRPALPFTPRITWNPKPETDWPDWNWPERKSL